MKAQIILLVGMLLIGASSFASDKNINKEDAAASNAITSISGTITDEATGESLVGVKVVLEGTDQVAYTDFDGMFKFDGVRAGEYTVSCDYISYEDKEALVDTKKDNDVAIKLQMED